MKVLKFRVWDLIEKKNAAMGRHHESSCMGDFSGHTRATRILRHAMYRIKRHEWQRNL